MNDNLPTLHSKASELLVRNLSNRVSAMRCGIGHFSPPLQEFAGGALVPTDAPGEVDAGSDLASGEGKVGQ